MEKVEISKLKPLDANAALGVFLNAFNAPKVGAHIEVFYDSYKLYPNNWLTARIGEKIIGTVAAFDYNTLLHIGYVSVTPQYQKQGVGKLLMDSIMPRFSNCKVTSLNATDIGAKLYNKIGFKGLAKVYCFSLPKEKFQWKHKGRFSAFRPWENMILDIVHFDRQIFNMERSRVIECLLHKFLERTVIARNQAGNLLGYAVCSREHIGPFLALNEDCALALLGKIFELPFESNPTVIVSELNPKAVQLFTGLGAVKTQGTKMFLGNSELLASYKNVWSEVSYALG